MKTIPDLLREADPLSREADTLAGARARIRRAAVEASQGHPLEARPVRGALAGSTLLTAVAALLIAAGLASFFWTRDGGAVQAAVRFEVRLAERDPRPGLREARVAGTNRLIYLHDDAIVTNAEIERAEVVEDGGRFSVEVRLTETGARLMRRATEGHLDRPVAILIDGQVLMAPIVTSPIGESAAISGDFTRREAERIATGIGIR